MRRALRWAVWLPAVAAAMLFAIDNRSFVTLSVDPFPYTLEAPLYLIALIVFALGVIVGGITQANARRRFRRELRAAQARIAALENELTSLRLEHQPLLAHAS